MMKVIKLVSFPISIILSYIIFLTNSPVFYFLYALTALFIYIRATKSRTRVMVLISSAHLLWILYYNWLGAQPIDDSNKIVFSRIGLLIYLIPLIVQFKVIDQKSLAFIGRKYNDVYFPFIDSGVIRDSCIRFTSLFLIGTMSLTLLFFLAGEGLMLHMIPYYLFFILINAVIETIIFRGIIDRYIFDEEFSQFKLIVSSVTFGFYHLPLGFSIKMCLIFSIGGYFMSGLSNRYNAVLYPMFMHMAMNALFISLNLIF